MKNSAIGPKRVLEWREPPEDIAHYVYGFVHRDDEKGGGPVQRLLPDIRASLQFMLADPYWTRGRSDDAPWVQVTRASIWGPKHDWCYGFAKRHVRAFAVGLTAAGLRALSGTPATKLLNQVIPLATFNTILADELDPTANETFDDWHMRAAANLRKFFSNVPPARDPIAASLDTLATAEGDAIAQAAEHAGLSARQYRRLFADMYGVSPKRYQRALRVDRMIRQLHTRPWESDAFEGAIAFADQAHSIREFRALTGMTPQAYAATKRDGDPTLRSVPLANIAGPETEPAD